MSKSNFHHLHQLTTYTYRAIVAIVATTMTMTAMLDSTWANNQTPTSPAYENEEVVVNCQSTRVDIKDLPHDYFKLKVVKVNGENLYRAEVTTKNNEKYAQFVGKANEDLLSDNMLAFEQSYADESLGMSSQNLNIDFNEVESPAQWGQYLHCEVVIAALFTCTK